MLRNWPWLRWGPKARTTFTLASLALAIAWVLVAFLLDLPSPFDVFLFWLGILMLGASAYVQYGFQFAPKLNMFDKDD